MIYIAIGSNQGNRLDNLRKATERLQQLYSSNFEISIVLETKAILPQNAPDSWDQPYLNMIVRGNTILSPEDLLQNLQNIEIELGRPKHNDKWAPRLIDLDILLWNNEIFDSPKLKVPHPELFNRSFLIHLLSMMDCNYHYVTDSSIYSGLSFGEIAHRFKDIQPCFLRSLVLEPKFVGVVNITPDSFSDGNLYFDPDRAIEKISSLITEGASVIELGAQSTRPNAIMISREEEWRRLEPVLDRIRSMNFPISIDSFSPEIILKVIEGYSIFAINDVSGRLDEQTLKHIANSGCKIIVMHSMTIPPNQNNIIKFGSRPIDIIYDWAKEKVKNLISLGFSLDQIIIDPGIGFGKSSCQSLDLLKNIGLLKKLHCKILVGHSRKSYIKAFSNVSVTERDLETIAISSELYNSGIDYLRVHNIIDHQRFFTSKLQFKCLN